MSIIPAEMATAIAADNVRVFYAVEFLLDAGPIRLWTGYGDRTIDGEVYTGSGDLMSIGDVATTADLSAPNIDLSLSGMPGEIISLALQESYQRRTCNIYFGTEDAGTHATFLAYSGTLNTMTIRDSGQTGVITVSIDSKLLELQRASNRRYTSESQKSRYSTDTFFDYVAGIQDAEIVWGR